MVDINALRFISSCVSHALSSLLLPFPISLPFLLFFDFSIFHFNDTAFLRKERESEIRFRLQNVDRGSRGI
ncbi:hypothetical protein ACOSQ4_003475 [Xanthoceras sorbifolium]